MSQPTQRHLNTFSKLTLAIALAVAPSSALSVAQDYNGNLISKNKIVFNNKSSNAYIQSLTKHTINFDGLLDQPFGNNPTNLPATPLGTTFIDSITTVGTQVSIALQPDGKIVMGGTSYDGTSYHFAAVRLLSNGTIDSSFGGPSAGYPTSQPGTMFITPTIAGDNDDECFSIALQADGKIVMGGYSKDGSGAYHFAAARLLPNGTLDRSFNAESVNGAQPGTMFISTTIAGGDSDGCLSIALQPDGKIVMGGYSQGSGVQHFAAARLLPNGTLDNSFGNQNPTNGTMFISSTIAGGNNDSCISIALQPDGKIVMGGYSYDSVAYHFAAARLLPNGTLDRSFNAESVNGAQPGTMFISTTIASGNSDGCLSIALQPDGKIVMGGYSHGSGAYHFAAARLLSNGTLDNSFGNQNPTNGTMFISSTIAGGNNDKCISIALQPDGKIVMGGYSSDGNGAYHFAAARLLPNGALDNSFGNNPSGPAGTMYITPTIAGDNDDKCFSIALQPDGKIVMGGYSKDGTNYRFALARLINPMTLQTYQASYASVGAGLYA